MKYLSIYLFIYLFAGCSNKGSKKNEYSESKGNIFKGIEMIDSLEIDQVPRIDTLSINRVLFNKQKFNISYLELKKKKKDSIVYSEWACGHPFEWKNDSIDFWSYYSKNLEYATNKEDALLIRGKFKRNTFKVENTNIMLTENTTLDDFKTFFPDSFNHYLKTKNKFPQDYKEKIYLYVAFEEEHPYHHWIFYFNKKGFLIRFELYWWLC